MSRDSKDRKTWIKIFTVSNPQVIILPNASESCTMYSRFEVIVHTGQFAVYCRDSSHTDQPYIVLNVLF